MAENAKSNYQMPSMQKENVDATNAAMGYHNMADRANISKAVQPMEGEKMRKQIMGQPRDGSESEGRDF